MYMYVYVCMYMYVRTCMVYISLCVYIHSPLHPSMCCWLLVEVAYSKQTLYSPNSRIECETRQILHVYNTSINTVFKRVNVPNMHAFTTTPPLSPPLPTSHFYLIDTHLESVHAMCNAGVCTCILYAHIVCINDLEPPQVYHPNIDLEGNVCLNILR